MIGFGVLHRLNPKWERDTTTGASVKSRNGVKLTNPKTDITFLGTSLDVMLAVPDAV